MLAAADRIPALRRQLDGMHPYAVAVSPLLAARRALLAAELEALTGSTTATNNNTEKEDEHGPTQRP